MSIITISREFGAGGLTLSKRLAEQLNYTHVDEQAIRLIAKKAKVSKQWVQAIESEAGSKLHQFINRLVPKGLVDRILNDRQGYLDEEIYINMLNKIISQIAKKNNCVILGRGGQFILKDHPDAFHFLLVADRDDRVRFLETHYHLPSDQANQVATTGDKRRHNLYLKFDKSNFNQPIHYHLTLNMSKLTMAAATSIIAQMVTGH